MEEDRESLCYRERNRVWSPNCHNNRMLIQDSLSGEIQKTKGRTNSNLQHAILAPKGAGQLTLQMIDIGVCPSGSGRWDPGQPPPDMMIDGMWEYGAWVTLYECDNVYCTTMRLLGTFCGEDAGAANVTSSTGIMFVQVTFRRQRPGVRQNRFVGRWDSQISTDLLHLLPQKTYVPGLQPLDVKLALYDALDNPVAGRIEGQAIVGAVCVDPADCAWYSRSAFNTFFLPLVDVEQGIVSMAGRGINLACSTEGTQANASAVIQVQLGTDEGVSLESSFTFSPACSPCVLGSTVVEEGD
eukprot:3914221-Rhodomonas_salina.1